MDIADVSWIGPDVDDHDILETLPKGLTSLLASVNGFVQFGGGLHLRGACLAPDWHALRHAWIGPEAFHELYPAVSPDWVPFAEDCVGDQFLLEDGHVLRLSAETGDVVPLYLGLRGFFEAANADPVGFLSMEPLIRLRQDGATMPEGHLILAYPPFCARQAADGVSLKALPAGQVHAVHATLARQMPPDDGTLRVDVVD